MMDYRSDAELFVACGHYLCGSGVRWKEQMAHMLGIKVNSTDNMAKGTSRIPPGIWRDVVRLIDERRNEYVFLMAAVEQRTGHV